MIGIESIRMYTPVALARSNAADRLLIHEQSGELGAEVSLSDRGVSMTLGDLLAEIPTEMRSLACVVEAVRRAKIEAMRDGGKR